MSQLTELSISKLIIAGAVAATLGAGYALKSNASADDEVLWLGQLADTARAYAKADPDATNITATNLITAKKVSPSRVSGTTTITGKWGGSLAVAAANVGGAANDGFTFTETAPTSNCEALAKGLAERADTISIGGTAVKSYGGNLATSGATGVTTLCAATATPSMVFGFSVK